MSAVDEGSAVDRCETCGKQCSANARFCGGCGAPRPVPPTPPPTVVQASSSQPRSPLPPEWPIQPQPGSGPSRWMIAGIAAVVAALVGIGVAVVLTKGGSSTPTRLVAAPVVTVTTAGASSATAATQPAASTAATAATSTAASPQHATAGATTSTTATSSAVPAPAGTNSPPSEQQQVQDTIHQEFALISQHRFSAAYALLAPSLQTGEQSWVDSHRENGIYSVNVATTATVHSRGAATASIRNMRTLDGEGCKNWRGSWNLIKIDGKWRISEANIAAGTC